MVDLAHAGADVGQRERVFGARFDEHLAAGFLEGIDLRECWTNHYRRADATTQHIDAFAERAAEDEAEDGIAVERILDEARRAFRAQPAGLDGDVGFRVEVAHFLHRGLGIFV